MIGVAAALDHQRVIDQRNRMVKRDAQPQVIVFAHGQTFVEAAHLLKQCARQHHRRRTHQAKFQARNENIPRRFAMFGLGIDPDAVTNPDFFSLADLHAPILIHKRGLDRKFLPQPEIVRIEKRQIASTRVANC